MKRHEFKIQAKDDIELYNIYDFVTKCKEIWALEGAGTWKYFGLKTWVTYLGASCKSRGLGLNAILHGVAQSQEEGQESVCGGRAKKS